MTVSRNPITALDAGLDRQLIFQIEFLSVMNPQALRSAPRPEPTIPNLNWSNAA
jgi:hypothetical protein